MKTFKQFLKESTKTTKLMTEGFDKKSMKRFEDYANQLKKYYKNPSSDDIDYWFTDDWFETLEGDMDCQGCWDSSDSDRTKLLNGSLSLKDFVKKYGGTYRPNTYAEICYLAARHVFGHASLSDLLF